MNEPYETPEAPGLPRGERKAATLQDQVNMGESKLLGRSVFVLVILVIFVVIAAFCWLVYLSATTIGPTVALVGTTAGGMLLVFIILAAILYLAALAFYPKDLADEIVDLSRATQESLAASSAADYKSIRNTSVDYD